MINYLAKSWLKYLTYFLLILLVLFHFWSLGFYPLPWFDETFYATVAKDFQLRGHFFPWASPSIYNLHEVYSYGPVYFVLQAAIYGVAGFNSYVSRLQGLVLGIVMIYSFLLLYRVKGKGPAWIEYLLLLGLLFDYTVFEAFHLGRMESLAITLLNFSLLLQLKSLETNDSIKQYKLAALYGFLAMLAVLTTPRTGVLLIPTGSLLLWNGIKERKAARFIELFIYAAIVVLGVAAWIFFAFGNIHNMDEYFKIVANTTDFVRGFSIRDSIYIYQFPVFICTIIVLCIVAINLKSKMWDSLTFIILAGIILFYAVVTIYRPYTIYTIPLLYLLMAHVLRLMVKQVAAKKVWQSLAALAMLAVVFFMVATSSLKCFYIVKSASNRKPAAIDAFVKANIPAGSRVVGDDVYFYSVHKAGSQFNYRQVVNQFEEVEDYERNVFDYQYLFVSDVELNYPPPERSFKLYNKYSKLELVAEFEPKLDPITAFINKRQPGLVSFYMYNGKLYKRVK